MLAVSVLFQQGSMGHSLQKKGGVWPTDAVTGRSGGEEPRD